VIVLLWLACSGDTAPEATPPAPAEVAEPAASVVEAPVEGHWFVHLSEENLAGLQKMKDHQDANPDDARAAMMVDMLSKLAEREVDITPATISFSVKGNVTVLNGTLSPHEAGWRFEAPNAGKVFVMSLQDDGMLSMGEEGKDAQLWKRAAAQ